MGTRANEITRGLARALLGVALLASPATAADPLVPGGDHRGENHVAHDHGGESIPGIDLSPAGLSPADLSRADFSLTVLDSANLSGAVLERTNLTDASLRGAVLDGAQSPFATLDRADASCLPAGACTRMRGVSLRWASLRGARFVGADFGHDGVSGVDLLDADLTRADFTDVDFTPAAAPTGALSAILRGAAVSGARFNGVVFGESGDAPADLSQLWGECVDPPAGDPDTEPWCPEFQDAKLVGANLRFALLPGIVPTAADLTGADLTGATLDFLSAPCWPPSAATPARRCMTLTGAILRRVSISSAGFTDSMPDLAGLVFDDIEMNDAVLLGADFYKTKKEVEGELAAGEDPSLAMAYTTSFRGAVLSSANFSDADLTLADFTDSAASGRTRLDGAIFSGAIITASDFSGALLQAAVLNGASTPCTTPADLSEPKLCTLFVGADLSDASLQDTTSFAEVSFAGATLTGANLSGTNFAGADFSGAMLRNANLQTASFVAAEFARGWDGVPGKCMTADVPPQDVMRVDLSGAQLAGAAFAAANGFNDDCVLVDRSTTYDATTSFPPAFTKQDQMTLLPEPGAVGLGLAALGTLLGLRRRQARGRGGVAVQAPSARARTAAVD